MLPEEAYFSVQETLTSPNLPFLVSKFWDAVHFLVGSFCYLMRNKLDLIGVVVSLL